MSDPTEVIVYVAPQDLSKPMRLVAELDYAKLAQDFVTLRAERDALRTVYDAAAVYCGDRTVAHEHALIDAVGAAKAAGVQP